MADRVMSAEVVLTAKDATGATFAALGKKIDSIGKAAKSSAQVDALAKILERAQAQMKAIDALQSKRETFGSARAKFRETQVAVEQAARAMRGAGGATKALKADYDKARAAVSRASTAFEKQKVAVLDAKRALEGFGTPVGRIASEQKRLKGVIDSTTVALERQARAGGAAGRRGGHGGGSHGDTGALGLVGLGIAHGAGHFAHRVAETFGEFDKEERYARVVMGLDRAGMQPLVMQAIHGAAASRFNDIQWLESQRELAARGYNREQVMGFAPVAAQLGQAFDVSMPEGVKLLEGALLGFKKNTSTGAAAAASAQRTADLQVKASKISGMTAEDIQQAYKYAAAPAQMAGLSEEQMLAFAAIAKKANMPGDESGTAIRALAKNMLTPTSGAQVAMRAAGVDFNSYQKMPGSLNTAGFVDMVARQYGVKLDGKAVGGLDSIFHNKGLIGNASAFMPAVLAILNDTLGGDDAKSKHKIAGLASRYRDSSSLGVDTNGLMTAVMTAMAKNPALANSIFGSKQGGRIFTALGDPKFFGHMMDELQNKSQGFAQKVSDARMEGFYASVQKLTNSVLNVETAMGRAFDTPMTGLTTAVAGFAQHLAEANPIILRTGSYFAAAGAAVAGLKGLNIAGEIVGGLRMLGKGGGLLQGASIEAGALGALSIAGGVTVGTMAIVGAAAVALVDALNSGPKKARATDNPNFANPLQPMMLPMGGNVGLPGMGGGGRGQSPGSKRKTDLPGHYALGRGGVMNYIVDPVPEPFKGRAPLFAIGAAGAAAYMTGSVLPLPMNKIGLPSFAAGGLPSLPASGPEKFGPLTAKLEGQAVIAVKVEVDGPGRVTFTGSSSSGDIAVKTGTTMARTATNGRVAGPN